MNALVIALGQTLRRDDGAAAELLRSVELPEGCLFRVLPQLMPELVDDLARTSRVLFVDAAVDGTVPSLVPVRGSGHSASFSHFTAPAGLLDLCRRLHGCEPDAGVLRLPAFDLGFGEGLSAALQSQLPHARELLEQWLAGSPARPG